MVPVFVAHDIASERKKTFADSKQNNRDSLEARIVGDLWQWAFASEEARDDIVKSQSSFAVCLEFYLGQLLHFVPLAKSRGWWCDGVLELRIARTSRLSFRIVGAAYLGACNVGPFELEFYFARRRDIEPTKVILRCGLRDDSGLVWRRGRERNAAAIVSARPPRDDEWAIAVEFLPEEE